MSNPVTRTDIPKGGSAIPRQIRDFSVFGTVSCLGGNSLDGALECATSQGE